MSSYREDQLQKSLQEAHAQWSKQRAALRTDLARLADQRLGETHRADRAEARIASIRNLLERVNEAGARELATEWDLERKRRDR